ncbi:MAG: hypothetical protein ACLP1X_20435 [Polyangiaceae bacterium]
MLDSPVSGCVGTSDAAVTKQGPGCPIRSPASRKVVWLTAALVAAATAGGIFYAAAHRPKPPDKPIEAPTATAPAPAPPPPVAPSEPLPSREVAPPQRGPK